MAKTKKALTQEQKENLMAALIKSMPDASVENVKAVATALITGYNLGRQTAQTA